MLTAESAQCALHTSGFRLTPQRLMVVNVLIDNKTHPTIEQIYERVRQHYPTISLATIYQTVTLLAKQGLVSELNGGKDGVRCDPDTSPHAHAYCQLCGGVFDVPVTAPLSWPPATLAGFILDRVEVSLYGHCSHCTTQATHPHSAE